MDGCKWVGYSLKYTVDKATCLLLKEEMKGFVLSWPGLACPVLWGHDGLSGAGHPAILWCSVCWLIEFYPCRLNPLKGMSSHTTKLGLCEIFLMRTLGIRMTRLRIKMQMANPDLPQLNSSLLKTVARKLTEIQISKNTNNTNKINEVKTIKQTPKK